MRTLLAYVLECIGIAALLYGLWLVYPPLAWIAGGTLMVFVAQGGGRP